MDGERGAEGLVGAATCDVSSPFTRGEGGVVGFGVGLANVFVAGIEGFWSSCASRIIVNLGGCSSATPPPTHTTPSNTLLLGSHLSPAAPHTAPVRAFVLSCKKLSIISLRSTFNSHTHTHKEIESERARGRDEASARGERARERCATGLAVHLYSYTHMYVCVFARVFDI